MRFLVPLLADLSEPQYRLLLFLQAVVVRYAQTASPPLTDADIAEASAAVAATFETAGKGIIYEHQAASIPAQRLATELGHAIAEMRRKGAPASLEREATATLRKLERGARTASSALTGDDPPIFLGMLRRVMASVEAQVPEARSSGPAAGGSGLIIPG
jgi:hypothetical protein